MIRSIFVLSTAVLVAVCYAEFKVDSLSASYVRVKGSDIDVCDSTLQVKASGGVIKGDGLDFDGDTTCTGNLSFVNAKPKNPLFSAILSGFPVESLLFSNSTMACTKKGGEDFTFSALAVRVSKNTSLLEMELNSERVGLVLFSGLNYCAYQESSLGVCFPSTAQVQLSNGEHKSIDKLRIDDEVNVGRGQSSRVFMFTHALANQRDLFIKLSTVSGNTVTLTPSHHLYVNGVNKAAREVRIGDSLELVDGTMSNVVNIESVYSEGLFNPQTLHGDIVVDGVRVSTYTETVHPGAAHALLAPFRSAYQYARATCATFESGMPDFRGLLS